MLRDGRAVRLRPIAEGDDADLFRIQAVVLAENQANVEDKSHPTEERRVEYAKRLGPKLWLVAEANGSVVGSLELSTPRPQYLQHLRYLSIELLPEWRGAGLGSAMIQAAIAWARTTPIEMILLGVLDSNPRAKLLYERLGFQQTGHIPRFVKRPDGSYSGDTQMAFPLLPSP